MSLPDLLRAGFAAFDAGDLKAADQAAQQAQKAAPRQPGGHYLRGLVALVQGQPRPALGHFKQAERLGEAAPSLLIAQADALVDLRRADEALAVLARALDNGASDNGVSDNGAVAYRQGQILAAQGKLTEAVAAFARAADLRPDHAESFNNLGTCLRDLGRPQDAITAYRRAVALRPGYVRALANLGVALSEAGDLDAAIATLERAHRLDPSAPVVAANLAHACKLAGDWARALPLFAALAERAPEAVQPWLDYGLALQAAGGWEMAETAFAKAAACAPADPRVPFCRAELARARGLSETAAEHYRAALARDPTDRCGAALGLALLGAQPVPDAAPAAYVADLFDGYAARFERELTATLAYTGPAQLAALAERVAPGRRFAAMLDLGCGTGLAAEAFAGRVAVIDGVDLSAKMVELARAKGIYRRVAQGDVTQALRAVAPGSLDLIVAADVLVYLGDLAPVLAAACCALRPDGYVLATLERAADADADGAGDWRLHDGHRYAHRPAYVEAALAGAGLRAAVLEPISTRINKGEAVAGLILAAAPNSCRIPGPECD